MQAFSGCERCGYVGRTYGYRDGVMSLRSCPRCDGELKEIGIQRARLLARRHRREQETGFREKVQEQLSELEKDRLYDAGTGSSSVEGFGSAK